MQAEPNEKPTSEGSSGDEWAQAALPGNDHEQEDRDGDDREMSPGGLDPLAAASPSPKRKRGRPRAQPAKPAAPRAERALVLAKPRGDDPHPVAVPVNAPDRLEVERMVQVSSGALLRLRKAPRLGDPHPLFSAVQAAHTLATTALDFDEDAKRIVSALLGTSSLPIASQKVLLGTIDTSRKKYLPRARTTLASVFVASREARWELEVALSRPRPAVQCVLYLDAARYDETPMMVRSAGASSTSTSTPTSRNERFSGALPLAPLEHAVQWSPNDGECASTVSPHSKILQTESTYGMLLRVNDKFIGVMGSVVCNLQLLETCSARCLMASQVALSSITPACGMFKHRVRLSSTDRAASNILCEKNMATQLKDALFDSVRLGCDVHAVSRIHTKVFSLAEPQVTGVLRHALSLAGGAHMNLFRKAIRLEIRRRGGVKLIQGAPSLALRRRREYFLRLFAARGRNVIAKRALLLLLPNGDWRSHQVEMYVASDSAMTAEEAERLLANGLVTALAGHMFELYPRHRWCGADLAFDRCGLMEAVHNLGSGSYRQFMALLGARSSAAEPSMDGEPHELHALDDVVGPADARDDLAADFNAAAQDGAEFDLNAKRALNAKHRRLASEWWETKPLAALVTSRLVMEPLRQLMKDHLEMCGCAWEQKQAGKAADRSNSGESPKRDLRIVVAATLELENKSFRLLDMLMTDKGLWVGLPTSALTVRQRCLAFRMLSRVGCSVEELLRAPHRRMPIALFRLLASPTQDVVDELKNTPACMRDDWSKRFLTEYDNPLSEEALASLTLIAMMAKMDIAQIECRHASIRRWLHSRIQTHTMDFSDLSGAFMSQQVRTLLAGFSRVIAKPKVFAFGSGRSGQPRSKKQKHSGGGACRAYFSMQLRIRKLRLKDAGVAQQLHAEYKALTAEEKATYVTAGGHAARRWRTASKKYKVSSFGVISRRRHAIAAAQDKRKIAMWKRLDNLNAEERLATVVDKVIPQDIGGRGYLQAVSNARSAARLDAATARGQQADLDAGLAEWRNTEGNNIAQALVEALGIPPDRAPDVVANMVLEPCEHANVVRFFPDITKATSDVTSWAHAHSGGLSLRSALAEDWARRHFTLLERECPTLQQPAMAPRKDKPPDCLSAGICLCNARGQKTQQMYDAFIVELKKAFPRNSTRHLLNDGFAVCQLCRSRADRDLDTGCEPHPHFSEKDTLYLHVGLQYGSPFRPTFSLLLDDQPAACGLGEHPEYVLIDSTHEYMTAYRAMAMLNQSDSWTLQFYELENTMRPIAEMVPGRLGATRRNTEPVTLWPRKRRRVAVGPGAPDNDHHGNADDDSAGEGEEQEEIASEAEGVADEDDDEGMIDALALLDEAAAVAEGPPNDADVADDGVAGPIVGDAFAADGDQGGLPAAPAAVGGEGVAGPAPGQHAPAAPVPRGVRGRALVQVEAPGGTLAFYDKDGRFTAVCANAMHGKCVATRNNTKRSHMRGRPCGFLTAWLACAPFADTKEEHWAAIATVEADLEGRRASREALLALEGGQALVANELGHAEGARGEPDDA
jgi:hypothetical protein